MGKHRKPAKGSGAKTSSKLNDQNIPSFDENALSSLTQKIEQGFAKGVGSQTPSTPVTKSGKQSKRNNSTNPEKSNPKSKPQESRRGTKRDAQGNAKEKSNGSSSKSQDPASERETLLQEILALGGTEEDLDLVLDAASDSENEDEQKQPTIDKNFKNEFSKFVASLGIEGKAAEESVDEDEEEEWEQASDSEAEPSEQEEAPKAPVKAATKAKESASDPNRLVFESRADWHAVALPPLPSGDFSESGPYQSSIRNLKEYATTLLEADSALYASKHLSATSSHRFLSTIMSSGTLSDKISALTLVVQESPVHTTKSFESLLGLAKKRSRGQAVTALGAMKDLLGAGVVLPSDRRLRTFVAQPGLLGVLQESSLPTWKSGQLLPGDLTKVHLIYWAFEDWLKEQYFEMLKILEVWCNDEVEYARTRAVTYVYELLKEKPEQEANLLRLLVNKLGDPDKKIASRASYLLLQLQTSHPLMKPIVVNSIENELILRPGQSSHAKYYAINTLNQTILSSKEEEVAKKLLSIYFGLFVSLLKKPEPIKASALVPLNKKGEIQGGGAPMGRKAKAKLTQEEEAKQASEETTEKMISAVLTGVNRAFPFCKSDDSSLEKHMDTLFRITHSSNFNTSIQALMLIEQLATTKHLAVDRFYRTLYESLLDPRLITSSKHALYLNLLYRSLKNDINIKRVKAFAKRMLQVVTLHQPPFICGIIYLIRELEITFPGLKTMVNAPETNDDDDEEVFRDVPEDGDAMESQDNHTPSKAREEYDGRKRDPEHSNADKSCLWEIIPFLVHFHPSVSLFTERLLNNEKMPPKPDLASHTLTHFLDRFVYRNAKAAAGAPKGSSIMQPLAGGDSRGILLSHRGSKAQQSVNSESFWRKKAEDVAVDEAFFHKYFNQIGKSKHASKSQGKKGPLGDDEDDEDEIWQALVESKPDIEGEIDDDDSEMDDLDMSDDEEDDDASDGGVDIEGSDDEDVDMGDAGDESPGIFDEEDDDLKDSDDDAGSDIDALFEAELQEAKSPAVEGKKKDERREKKKKLKNLPMFASADDYATMLDNDGDEDFGMGR